MNDLSKIQILIEVLYFYLLYLATQTSGGNAWIKNLSQESDVRSQGSSLPLPLSLQLCTFSGFFTHLYISLVNPHLHINPATQKYLFKLKGSFKTTKKTEFPTTLWLLFYLFGIYQVWVRRLTSKDIRYTFLRCTKEPDRLKTQHN